MEDIDLGDRRGLIDLIYGQPQKQINDTPSASSNTLTPLTENKNNKKKERSNVVCSFSTAVMLFLLAAAAVFLCGFIAYWFTRQEFEMKMAELNYAPQQRRNMSQMSEEVMYEEEPPPHGPTAEELRLPRNVEPIWLDLVKDALTAVESGQNDLKSAAVAYNLTLRTYIPGVSAVENEKNLTTDGNIMIKLKVLSTTEEIVLNAKDLSFPSDPSKVRILKEDVKIVKRAPINETLEGLNEEEMLNVTSMTPAPVKKSPLQLHGSKVERLLYNDTLQKLILTLDKAVQSGEEVIVQLPFKGRITENTGGVRHSWYRTKTGNKKIISYTSVRPGYTRSIYPCLDEPQFKAPLSLAIIHPRGTTATSNAMELHDSSETSEPLWDKTTFDATSALPTQLIGFTVSDFESNEAATKTGLKVRVFSRREAKNSTTYALDTAVKVLDLLQEYFNTPLSNNKLDLFAVPTVIDSSTGAHGIIFLPEENMLLRSNDVTEQKVKVAEAVSQEMTRQWFGDLVVNSDWNTLWLNEGFANYMKYFVLEKIFEGDLDGHNYQTSESFEPALIDDSRSSSHPVTLNAETPEKAQEFLDQVTAEKSGALLRMIKEVVGEEVFRKGIQDFFMAHARGSANYTDFWHSLDNAVAAKLKAWDGSRLKMADFGEKWILQMGYPVVEVYRLDARTIELTQRRFKLDHLTPERAEYRNAQYWYKWDIPIFYDVNGKKMDMVWLHEAVRLPINISDTFLINPESLGYYRVNYDEQMWTAIADQLKKNHKSYPSSARARILSDALALAESKLLPYELAFEVISYLPNEKDYLPWISVLRGLENLYGRLSKTELEEEAKKFVSEKLAEFFKSLDLDDLNASDNSKVLESQVRKRIAVLYCDLLPEECRKKLVSQFESNFMAPCESYNIASDCSKVSPSIRPWVYCVGLANGGEKEFEKISKLFTLEVDAAEKRQLLAALSCSRDPRKLRKLLHVNMLSEASPIPEQDVQNLVESMNNQDVGAEIVSDFMLDNWKEFMERFSHDKITLSNVLRSGIRLESERDIKQFERFLADHSSTTLGLQVLKLQLEKARNQVEWLKKNKETMKKLLSSTRSEKEL